MSPTGGAEEYAGSEIAVIGMAGRFPGARSVRELWRNLRDGVESVSALTDAEILAAGVSPDALRSPNYVKAAVLLEDIELFDAPFFGLNPREAEIMDPQHRFFLECAWEALEAAGYHAASGGGPVGVFAGVSMSTYLMNIYSTPELFGRVNSFQVMLVNDKDHLPTRVSYKLDLKGPSVNVQTSCSTSLVAVHLACESLMGGVCDMALAGGVSIKVPQKTGYFYQEGGINSPDGHCRAFDAAAQGTIGGAGVGVVVLKRLADAVADGDHIHAVIKGSAINNDGAQKVGYTAPSVEGQAAVIAEAHSMAGVEPESIGYVEAHGTGTNLGDPIEIAALSRAFRTARRNFCAVGSVKSNLGHLDAAAGVTGLIKTVLALEHGMIPPSLHFEQPNPKIDFANSPFFVNARLRPWERGETPRRAGVSAFGIGGTNAHVVLEEAPAAPAAGDSRPWQLLVLSARTATALEASTRNLVAHLRESPDVSLADVAYTLQVGRKVFDHRRALVCRSVADAIEVLEGGDRGRVLNGVRKPRPRPVVFMFPGQGAQYVNMGAGLYRGEEAFRAGLDGCAEILRGHLGFDLRDVLYPAPGAEEEAGRRLAQTAVTQPALFAVEYALAQVWLKWGVRPAALIGHSVGEYVAACLSGVFSLEDGLALVAARGRLMQGLPEGAMLSVQLAEADVRPLLGARLSLAAVNGAALCVVSGPPEAVAELEEALRARRVGCRRLRTSHAFHSDMMEPVLDEFTALAEGVSLRPPQLPFISNVSGRLVTEAEATDARYWARHLRQTVRAADGLAELLTEPERLFLEVGPGQTLTTLVKHHPAKADGHAVVNSLPPAQGRQSDEEFLARALGQLWLAGVGVDWRGFYEGERRLRLQLPTYPFERQRYWVGRSEQVAPAAAARPAEAVEQAPAGGPQKEAAAEVVPQPTHRPAAPPDEAGPHASGAPAPAEVGDGNGHGPGGATAPPEVRERIIARQLDVMARQLELLRKKRLP